MKLVGLVAGILCIALAIAYFRSPLIQLRFQAESYKSYRSEAGQDFLTCVKAKVSSSEFHEFAQSMNLAPSTSFSWHGCEADRQLSWWSATPSSEGIYVLVGSSDLRFAMAKYESGYLFYTSAKY